MRRQLRKAWIVGFALGCLSLYPTAIQADPPVGSPTHSSRKNPLRRSEEPSVKIPANDLRSSFKPASAWRSELFAVDDQLNHFVASTKILGAIPAPGWSTLESWVHATACEVISKSMEMEVDAAATIEVATLASDEPPKFTQVDGFTEGSSTAELSISDSANEGPSTNPTGDSLASPGKSPKKRELKTPDEDMQDYLAQEFEPKETTHTDRSLQGVDAEKAKKPDLYGESRFGQSEETPEEAATASSFHGTPAQQTRLNRVNQALEFYLENPETTAARSPWAVMHALLAFGSDYELIGPNNKRVNAIGWMCHNGLCKTQRIFTPRGNSFIPNVGGGVQGHQGQFLAILAQCQVPPDYPIQIGDQKFTVEDLVLYEMATCREKSELTFKLIGLSYYLDSDKQWRSNDGKVWSIQKLIQEELAQPVVGSACGGTHRLMGYSFAIKQRVLQGHPLQGQYLRAAKFINEFIEYTWQLQNPDGSFSTNWFEARGNEPNVERKVQTTGHMLEWLLFTVSDSDVKSKRVEKAIDFLMANIYDNRQLKWPIGPRGHAERALALYHKRLTEILSEPEESVESEENLNIAGANLGNADSVVAQPRATIPQGAVKNPASPTNGSTSRTNNAQRSVRPTRPRR